MKTLLSSFRLLAVLTFLLGGLYPLAVWAIGRGCLPSRASGSLVLRDGVVVGSALLAQRTVGERYFHPRPSAADYATLPSGASNLAWTSSALRARVASAGAGLQPAELLTTSGSGLDPHLSVAAALAQVERVASARGWNEVGRRRAREWIAENVEGGHLGAPYVNVLLLNLWLDASSAPAENKPR